MWDDKTNPQEWRFAAGYEFIVRIPFTGYAFYSYRNFIWGGKGGGRSWYSYHFRKEDNMIPHTGAGFWKGDRYWPIWLPDTEEWRP
jgi:hypothetical protein